MSGEMNLKKLIASMTPVLSETNFVFATMTPPTMDELKLLQPIATFHEHEGLTLILEKVKADKFNINYEGIFNCITLNVHSSLESVGLTAAISTKLATANISANVFAAYYHDHIFVPAKDASLALSCLQQLMDDNA